MSKFRSLQFLRNQTIANVANHGEARTNFARISLTNVKDGEIILYSYKITDEEVSTGVHTLVGVVRENNSVKHLEILGNYDLLHNEIVNALTEAKTYTNTTIAGLNTTITNDGTDPVVVSITQTDGLLASVTVDVDNLSTEFQNIIKALDYTHADHFTQATDKKSFNIYATNQEDGQISEVVDGTIYFTDGVTSDNPGATQKYVDDSINALNTPEGGVSSEANQNILVTVEQENGIVTSVSVDETALEERLAAIEDNNISGENAIVVDPENNANKDVKVSLKIANTEKVLSQDGNGLKSTLTVDTIKYGEDAGNKAGKTYIQIKGIGGEVISETDAAAFVKDGFLQKVELIEATAEGQENVLRFTWNSDAGISVTEIKVSDLCDVYTADETYLHLNGFKFKHKEVFPEAQQKGSVTIAEADAAEEYVEFAVPTIKVDKAGHVIDITDNTVKVTLPKSIATAVQTVTSTEAVNATDKFVAVHATRTGNNVVLTSEVKTKDVATATATDDGVALAADVQQYVLNNSSVVEGTEGQITVTPTTNNNGPETYTVSLPARSITTAQELEQSFADEQPNDIKVLTNVTFDTYGRVESVQYTKIIEDINCGYWDEQPEA